MGAVVLLAVLLVLVAIGREVRGRRAFAEDGPAFRCRFRRHGPAPADWRWLRTRWSRRMYARWAGDMLVIRRGPVRDRTLRVMPRVQVAGVYVVPRSKAIAVRLSVGSAVVEMTAAAENRLDLVGPFLAAAIHDLPQAPMRRYRL
jgi:hypothetical protein